MPGTQTTFHNYKRRIKVTEGGPGFDTLLISLSIIPFSSLDIHYIGIAHS